MFKKQVLLALPLSLLMFGCGLSTPWKARKQFNLGVCGSGIFVGLHVKINSDSLTISKVVEGPNNAGTIDDKWPLVNVENGRYVFQKSEGNRIELSFPTGVETQGQLVVHNKPVAEIKGNWGKDSEVQEFANQGAVACFAQGPAINF